MRTASLTYVVAFDARHKLLPQRDIDADFRFLNQVIGKHIADVEALGDIGQSNLDKIAKIVSKHRALNSENLKLFLDIGHRELTLYDCTSTSEPSPMSSHCLWPLNANL